MSKIEIREALPDDVGTLLQLVKQLAAFEREPDAVIATEAGLLVVVEGFVCGPVARTWYWNVSGP